MDPERLRFAIRRVMEGEAALPRKLVTRLMEEFRREERRTIVKRDGSRVNLTPREWAVAELLADGATTSDIARSLHLSEVTIRRHISTAAAKPATSRSCPSPRSPTRQAMPQPGR